MSQKLTTLFISLAVLLIASLPMVSPVNATNGYFSHGYGVQSKSMGGVAVALPRDAFVAASNPAAMLELGRRYDIGISLFNPNRNFTVTGNPSMQAGTFPLTPGNVESDSKLFFIPSIAANWMLNPKTSLGVSIFGNGGMNTNYDTKVFDNPMAPVTAPTGVNLMQLFVMTTLAREVVENHSLGIAGIFGYQMFEAKGLQAFSGFSSDPTKLTNNDNATSTGFGARFGYYGKLTPAFHIGASYQTKVYMSEFDEYAGLFAEKGDFDVPANWTVGIAVKPSRTLTLAADVQTIMYSDVKSVGNLFNPQYFQQGVFLGVDSASGFGWDDMTIFKFGLEWEGIVDLPIRLGYSYGEQPIPDTEVMFNILAPGVIEHHITFGFSRKLCAKKEISFSVMHALTSNVTGANPMEVPDQQTIDLEMNQWEFSIGLSF
ncbi:MAG: outer membrane protein transport protein [bacterium]